MDKDIVKVYNQEHTRSQDLRHEMHKCAGGIAQSEWHSQSMLKVIPIGKAS